MGKPIWVACGTHLGHYGQLITVIWSSMPENLSSDGCKHQRGRPARTSALSDQHLLLFAFCKVSKLNWLQVKYQISSQSL